MKKWMSIVLLNCCVFLVGLTTYVLTKNVKLDLRIDENEMIIRQYEEEDNKLISDLYTKIDDLESRIEELEKSAN